MKKFMRKIRPIGHPLISITLIVILLVGPMGSGTAGADVLFGAEAGTLAREPQVTPDDLGDGALEGLQYADPAEQLDMIEPPVADNFGDAQLEHTITIPVGRAGLEPSVALSYDSGAGAGWVGTGWDLGVGEIVVDTRFGVPRYLADAESEGYILDGDVLHPTAVVSSFESPRVTDRSDFTRRVEDEFERIIRHGDSPTNYRWEVTDKDGTTRYYGATLNGDLDSLTVQTDANGNIFRWALSAEKDISNNIIRYFYEEPAGERVGFDNVTLGSHLYLNRILYTGSIASSVADDPAYEILFLRDDDISPTPTARKDIIIDARGGFINTTSDLLRRIEINYGDPVSDGTVARSSWDTLVRAYDLNYIEGAFGKSLLTSITQLDSTNSVVGSHDFNYYDEVRNGTAYDGLSGPTQWDPGNDALEKNLIETVDVSVLGSSDTTSEDVHAYIGFNPAAPSKTGSFGGAFSIDASQTEGIVEFMDINGDLLPDKVFRESTGGIVQFRLNQSGPDGGTTFGLPTPVVQLDDLSSEYSIGIAGGPEAHFGVAVQFSVAGDVALGTQYFEDVNNDGLPDFVSNGVVYFNRLVSGIPTFLAESGGSPVPLEPATASIPLLEELDALEDMQRDQSVVVDTIRRWIAPFAGTVDITAPVTFSPPTGETSPDGVRVAIQKDGSELWSATMTTANTTATPTGVTSISVAKGSDIYFRVGSIEDGAADQVLWNPEITYTAYSPALGGSPSTDSNDLSQETYIAADDFTLAGRPDTLIVMPFNGTVRLLGDLVKASTTSDNLTVQVLHNNSVVFTQVIADSFVGTQTIDTSFSVSAPSGSTTDKVIVRVRTDTPVGVTQVAWTPQLFYTSGTDGSGNPLQVGSIPNNPTLELAVPWDIDVYENNNLTSPQAPWVSNVTTTTLVSGQFTVLPSSLEPGVDDSGEFVISLKNANGIVGKTTVYVPETLIVPSVSAGSFSVNLVNGESYWFELTSRNPDLSARLTSPSVTISYESGGSTTTVAVPATHHWAGRQGVFPNEYRGWAYAGYNAEDRTTTAIDESAFVFQESNYPDTEPIGFDDNSYSNPMTSSESYPYVYTILDDDTAVWGGFKDNLIGGADFARSSRTGSDSPGINVGTETGARAVPKVGVSGPIFGIVLSLGGANVAASGGPTFGILDYMDLNGDAYPDIVGPNFVKYTGPRGSYLNEGSTGFDTVATDTTIAIGAGFSGSAIEIKGNSEGQVNNSQDVAATSGNSNRDGESSGSSASNGEEASGDEYGANVGGSIDLNASFTNPPSVENGDWADILDIIGGIFDVEYELEYADVNGDDLPDRVGVSATGIAVQLNLGYGFAPAIKWAEGGFENGEGYSGSIGVGLGFQINNKEFSGGASYNQSIDLSRYTWVDVDGDGVLDRLRKEAGISGIKVAFGSGAGLLPEVDYGTFESGSFSDNIAGGIPTGEAIAQGESTSVGGGADFTIGIGPLCIAACYVIINPGAHFERSISSNQVQFIDVDGDGYPDSAKSTDDDQLTVRSNKRGRTNLLYSVDNPLGGQIRLGYTRDGNTVAQPYPLWTMTSVEYDDNRAGDGPDTLLTTYRYENNAFDSLEREFLGYATVVEEQRDAQEDANPLDDPLVRQIERTYRNDNVFDAGLLLTETLRDPLGTPLKQTIQTWDFVDVVTGLPTVIPTTMDLATANALLSTAASPQLTTVAFYFYDDSGILGQSTRHTLEYDERGNVIRQVDEGESETTSDDLIAITTYSQCPTSGVSVSATFEVQDIGGNTLRKREGSLDLCLNAVPIEVIETIDGNGTVAVTNMTFDDWGSYNSITYPENADGQRFRVDYTYDTDRHTDIAIVTDSYGLTATTTFDGSTGRITSRTDPNEQTTRYSYDTYGRIASITGPYEQGSGNATVTFAYFPTASGYAYATASHYDVFNPGDTIDTVTFLDGIGRETQTKQDGTVFNGVQDTPLDVMVVGGAVEFDALGRPVKEWFPTTEALGTIGTYNTSAEPAANPLQTTWDLRDQPISIVAPNGNETTTAYGFDADGDIFGGATLFTTAITDPLGKPVTTWSDVRDNVMAVDDDPPTDALVRTRYGYNPLGELTTVIDPAGSVSTHSYDLLGRRLTTNTPNAGLLENSWDPAGNLIAVVDPVLRPLGVQVDYDYDFTRLMAINYPDSTPDVSYTYGAHGAADNGAGRVMALSDGVRDQTFTYDLLGAVASETSLMKVHNLQPSTEDKHTYTTSFTYDGFGRRDTIGYPDGEVLTHDYDSGGLLKSVTGEKNLFTYPYVTRLEYDQFFDRKYIAYGNGTDTEYSYDALSRNLGRLLTITPDREVQDLNYTYDATSKVTQVFNDVPNPKPNLFVGSFTHNYEYDPYYRISNATGEFEFAPRKRRTYSFLNEYDEDGNISYKEQTDLIYNNPRKGIVQKPTTYEIDFTYSTTNPNQLVETDDRTYSYDAAGNYTGWEDKQTGQNRSASFDSENRMVMLADQGSTTEYRYDHVNQLTIERGPGGELSFVNQWYTVENGSPPRKSIYVGDDQVVIKREMPSGEYEFMQYYQHKNLQGSTNIVTDENALVFQNLIYFPSGEIWVHEKSTEFPTPYRYAGGYFDEFREVSNFGERWYDARDQFFLSTDPILQDDPDAVIGDPALLPAYSYAASNPVNLVDPAGRDNRGVRASFTSRFAGAGRPSQPAAAHTSATQGNAVDSIDRGSRLWAPLQAFQDSAVRTKYQEHHERFDFKPLLQFNYKRGENGWKLETVKLGFLQGQGEIWKRTSNSSTDSGAGEVSLPNSVPMPDEARANGAGAAGASSASGGAASLAVPDSARDALSGAGDARSAPAPAAGAP